MVSIILRSNGFSMEISRFSRIIFEHCFRVSFSFFALQNVKFIVSVNEDSSLAQSIVRRKINHRKIDLPELALDDRAKVVRNVLSAYGKNLDENAFNNQMRILLSKRGSATPAYLLMACEQLRLFGSFENVRF